ncbi:cyclin-like protein [Polychytrium aggregatum]|uniref:cyclin-like protein n=1 Tax=Polychytrium aggregatum TaxID=110093 RepID=UPI0022FEF3C5|nr:cyclin-like protein [Polychytrium aggregatum]KAI9202755.1 cyclin-like protein [Polychytrium aggregatum]
MDGFYVGSGQSRARDLVVGRYGQSSVESRLATIMRGNAVIQKIANTLKIPDKHVEIAQRYYQTAVNQHFTKGRRVQIVASGCLYIVCREEKTSTMLIDFADVTNISIYAIGATFMKLVEMLRLNLPMVDPALYIARFAFRLEFEEKTQDVIRDATRLASRMSRDWIQTGRRPAGICAACLFVAARMHGFNRTIHELVRIAKICSSTLKHRLEEFKCTPSGNLTVTDFQTIWLEEGADPPSYSQILKKLPKRQRKSKSADEGVKEEDEESDADETKNEDKDDDEETRELENEVKGLMDADDVLRSALREQNAQESQDDENLDDLDNDEEVQCFRLTEAEVEFKTKIWTAENWDWEVKQQEKALRHGGAAPPRRARKPKAQQARLPAASSPAEALRNYTASHKKAFSKKINWDVFNKIDEPIDESKLVSIEGPIISITKSETI